MITNHSHNNIEPKKNVTAPAIIFLGLLAAFYYFVGYSFFGKAQYSNSNSIGNKNESSNSYSTYIYTIQKNQVLELKLRNNNDYYMDNSSIYQGARKVCSLSPEHISYYQKSYSSAKKTGFIEEGRRDNLEYVLSHSGNYSYYLIKIDDFYYSLTLYSMSSLDDAKECFDRLTITVKD